MARAALFCSLLLAGCHWIFGHAPPGADRGAPGDAPAADRRRDRAGAGETRLDRASDLLGLDGRDPDARKGDSRKPDLRASDLRKPDLRKPDLRKPDVLKLDLLKLDQLKPDVLGKVVSFDVSVRSPIFSSSTSWNHPVGCAGAVLVVGIVRFKAGTVASVTSNAPAPFTLGAASQRAELWYLANPPTSTVTIQVALQAIGEAAAGSASFCGANTGKLLTWKPDEAVASGSVSTTTGATLGSAIVGVVVTSATSFSFTPSGHNSLWTETSSLLQAGMGYTIVLPTDLIGWAASGNPSWSYVTGVLWVAP